MPAGLDPPAASFQHLRVVQLQSDNRRPSAGSQAVNPPTFADPAKVTGPALPARMEDSDAPPCFRVDGEHTIAFVIVTPRTAATNVLGKIAPRVGTGNNVIDLQGTRQQPQR